MKAIRTLGYVAAIAMAVMAFGGVSTASANSETVVLCEAAELECENPLPNPTEIQGNGTEPKLLTSIGTILCEAIDIIITLLNELSSLNLGHLLLVTFLGCHFGETECTVTTNSLGLLSFTKIGSLESKATSTGGTTVTVKCGSFINCTYGGEPSFTAHSSESGEVQLLANKTPVTRIIGFLCPSEALLDATLTAKSPAQFWIES